MNNQQASPQRRRFDRAVVDIPVSYSVLEAEGSRHEARAVDLSAGGLRIAGGIEVPQGSNIELRFNLSSTQREIVAQGRVIMSFFNGAEQRYEQGVAFAQIAQDDQTVIDEYVRGVARALKRAASS